MKRHGYLYESICSIKNLKLAEKKARKGKSWQYGVQLFDENSEANIINLHHVLTRQEYTTSKYAVFTINEGKERVIHRLPYYPDRIVHHAVMRILEPIFVSTFTADTYSCIKRRGIHRCAFNLKRALQHKKETEYCLKLDIKKFYPSIKHDILKRQLREKFKDPKLLRLLDNIIDSPGPGTGVPIGNYLSQFLANFYLSGFDHWMKENQRVRFYFRYCDDLVILGNDKNQLRLLLYRIQEYLYKELKLELKDNYQIFPVDSRGIDFVGYRFFHDYVLLRKTIKNNFIMMVKFWLNDKSLVSYNGWLKHCNSINLKRKYLHEQRRRVTQEYDLVS